LVNQTCGNAPQLISLKIGEGFGQICTCGNAQSAVSGRKKVASEPRREQNPKIIIGNRGDTFASK
jgi:hypothetical protein